jgi:tetratricopeptide (TPR) repeat protein
MFRLGAQELAAGMFDRAIESFEKGVQLKPDAKEGWYNLGIAYGRKKLYSKEAAAYQRALEIDPNYSNALHNLGLAMIDLGQKDKAIEALQKAVKVDPTAADAWNNLGVVMLDRGEAQQAVEAFRKAAEAAPNGPECRMNLGIALLRQADKETSKERRDPVLREALQATSDALAADAKFFRAAYNKGVILHRLGDADGEIAAYREAIAVKHDYAAALYNLAAALSLKDDHAVAIKAWEDYVRAAQGDSAERAFVENARKELVRLRAL